MRKLCTLATALFAVLALAAAAGASMASAEVTSTWLVGGALPTKAESVMSENTAVMVFEDMGVPASVECAIGAVTDEGTVGGPAGKETEDEVTKVSFTQASCKKTATAKNLKEESKANGCEKLESIKPINLPWLTEMMLVGSVFLDLIIAGGGLAPPGYEIICKTLLGSITDKCTTEVGSVNVTNTTGGVLAEFPAAPAEAEFANCTVGGLLQGLVSGTQLIAPLAGGAAITVSEETAG